MGRWLGDSLIGHRGEQPLRDSVVGACVRHSPDNQLVFLTLPGSGGFGKRAAAISGRHTAATEYARVRWHLSDNQRKKGLVAEEGFEPPTHGL